MKTKKKSNIIVFSNVKGGTGKTQICATAASYFVGLHIPTIVIDADVQQSLYRHRMRDLAACPSADTPWDCLFLNTTDLEAVKSLIEKVKRLPYTVLIDCPGNVNDPALSLIFAAADCAVVPFELNSDSVDATVIFARLLKHFFDLQMLFIPNKVSSRFWKRGEVRKAREDAMEQLNRKLGIVSPDIKYSAQMNSYSTLELPNYEKRVVFKDALEPITIPLLKVYNKK